jgi:tRNA pseudouridine55 synthase
LDPFATGLLICATGQYTRLLGYLEQLDKTYEAELLLGKQSATGDPEGEIIAEKSPEVDSASWETLRDKVLALSMLPIPQYSAVKIEGKRAYRYAREGHILQMPMREVKILDFELLSLPRITGSAMCFGFHGNLQPALSDSSPRKRARWG